MALNKGKKVAQVSVFIVKLYWASRYLSLSSGYTTQGRQNEFGGIGSKLSELAAKGNIEGILYALGALRGHLENLYYWYWGGDEWTKMLWEQVMRNVCCVSIHVTVRTTIVVTTWGSYQSQGRLVCPCEGCLWVQWFRDTREGLRYFIAQMILPTGALDQEDHVTPGPGGGSICQSLPRPHRPSVFRVIDFYTFLYTFHRESLSRTVKSVFRHHGLGWTRWRSPRQLFCVGSGIKDQRGLISAPGKVCDWSWSCPKSSVCGPISFPTNRNIETVQWRLGLDTAHFVYIHFINHTELSADNWYSLSSLGGLFASFTFHSFGVTQTYERWHRKQCELRPTSTLHMRAECCDIDTTSWMVWC